MLLENSHQRTYRVGHLACGLGAGALGFRQATAKVGNLVGRFETAGGIDIDPGAMANFRHLTGVEATHLDLFDREQYEAHHGHAPPEGWKEATPDDMRRIFGHLDVAFSSSPCKGMTTLLDPKHVGSPRYEALNELTLRCYMLLLEAYADDPIRILLLENVPGMATKGRRLLDKIYALLRHHGYSIAEDCHDVGPIGGLAQHRRRFLMVARHRALVPPFLYQPRTSRMRTVGEVLGALPLPGDPVGGFMHQVPNLKWRTWCRLAFIEPGSDWRSLRDLAVEDGMLRDWAIRPVGAGDADAVGDLVPPRDPHNQVMGVRDWNGATGTVQGASRPHNGAFCVADPRYGVRDRRSTLGVRAWDGTTGTVTGESRPTNGAFSVGDPRGPAPLPGARFFEIVARGGEAVADPRAAGSRGGRGKYRITGMDEAAGTVISSSSTGEGAFAVADGRVPAPCDPAPAGLPHHDEGLVAVIRSRHGHWNRPYTTLDLAALQGLVDPDHVFGSDREVLIGRNQESLRLWVGNAVPAPAARRMAETILETMLLADTGQTFTLSTEEIWCRPLAVQLALDGDAAGGAADVERRLGHQATGMRGVRDLDPEPRRDQRV